MTEAAREPLVKRLQHSRAALIEALAERTEQDFAMPLGGILDNGPRGGEHDDETLGHALAALALAERVDLAIARSEEPPDRELPERPLPPQVTHDLAGARHQTLTHLPELESDAAHALVEAITARETALITQISARVDAD